MAWTTPTRYPNSAEQANNEDFLNVNVIDNLVDHETRLLLAETAWTTWTPTLSGVTIGNGTVQAYYRKYGTTVNIAFGITLGSTSAITGDIQVTLPFSAAAAPGEQGLAVFYNDFGNATYPGVGIVASGIVYLRAINAASTYAQVANCSSTVPFTWNATDQIRASGAYFSA